MKNFRFLGVIALVAIMVSFSGCALLSSIGGTADLHGLFSGGAATKAITEGATEIASYSNILWLFDSGYAEYTAAVKKATAEGKQVHSVTKWMLILCKTTAYAQ